MQEGRMRTSYVVTDYFTTLLSVVLFSVARYYFVPDISERIDSLREFFITPGVLSTLAIFPPFMLLIYYLIGYYVKVYNKSRIHELVRTLVSSAIGAMSFFLVVLLNDVLPRRTYNYEVILLMGAILFICVYAGRVVLTTHYLYMQRRPGGGRGAVLVTNLGVSAGRVEHLRNVGRQHGLNVRWIVDTAHGNTDVHDYNGIPVARLDDINQLCTTDNVCILLDSESLSEKSALDKLNCLFRLNRPVFVSPDLRAMLMGRVQYNAIMNDPLVDISCSELPDNVVAVKRFLDIVLSGTALILTLPVIAVLGAMIRFQSAGPAIFSQERIGYRKKPFRLYKLRSMYAHSEPDGPRLSSNHDERITPIGKVIRRYRLDELPNLWNVFKGDMSIVGPRPERQYYIDRIIKKAPHYTLIHQVRPGLTSWGMVRYGYASDVDGMVERLKYDMLYLQNMSLSLDIRILYYTIFTVMRGEGK